MTKAQAAQANILWIGVNESTNVENGAGAVPGPMPGCNAPLEKLPPAPGSETVPPTDPTGLTAKVSNGNTVELRWNASTDNVGVVDYGVYRDGVPVATVQQSNGGPPAPTGYIDTNVPPGDYTYTVDAGDAVGNRSGMSAGVPVTTARQVAALPAGTPINDPPAGGVQIISFPSRDFVSSSGYLASDTVDVQLLRRIGGQLVLVSTSNVIPEPDPRAGVNDPFAGIVEVNHPGGGCWDGVTPDIRAGDVIREIARNPDGSIRAVNQTRTSTVVAGRPTVVKPATGTAADGVVEVHGTAMDANGDPINPAQVESRLVANRDLFDLNGRRTIRAGGAGKDGTFVYDKTGNPSGVKWTATFSGLTADDVARSVGGRSATSGTTFAGAESRALWLSATPVTAPEITIYENDGATLLVNGPAVPCTAPGESLDKNPPTFPSASPLSGTAVAGTTDVKLDWSAATDDVAVFGYRVYRDGNELKNVGPGTTTFTDHGIVGTHTYTVDANDAASPGIGGNAQGSPWGNRSAQSNAVTVSAADITPPTDPTNLTGTLGADGASVDLAWTKSTDNVAVDSYGIYRRVAGDPTWVRIASAPGTDTTYTDRDPALSPGATYEYTVDAADAANNRSAKATSATVILGTDTVAPSTPTGLSAGTPDVHVRTVRVAWTASTDNVAVTGYGVYRRQIDPSAATQPAFTKIADASGTATSYTDAALPAGTYEYTVDAADSAGNRSAQPNAAQAVTANDPPQIGKHSIIPFPARDFVSSTGYAVSEGPVTVSVIRNGQTIAVSTPIPVAEDPATPGLGAVEVNHPGGGCWGAGAFPNTPNLVPGDVVRFTDRSGIAEQTTVADVAAERPLVKSRNATGGGGTVVVHGTARDAAGNPLPVDQVESRLIANKDAFDGSGRRTLRAGGAGADGTLAYDAPGSTRWTATYDLPTADDLARAVGGTSASTGTDFVGAESRGVWLGRNPVALLELTIEENGPGVTGGPAAGIPGCTSGPAEAPAADATLGSAGGLTFAAQTVGDPASASKPVTLTNNGTASLRIDKAYVAGLHPGDFAISSQTCGATLAPGSTCTVNVTFKATAAGKRQANLSFLDNAANTTDQSVALTGSAVEPAVVVPGPPVQTLQTGTALKVVAPLTGSSIPAKIQWTASPTASADSYELQQSDNGGVFAVVAKAPSALSATPDVTLGSLSAPVTHQWRVRACDSAAGACSAWVTGPKVTTAPIDNSTSTSYKNMSGQSLAGAYNGSVQWSAVAGSTASPNRQTFTVSGNAAWISTLGPNRGKATVQVDGRPAQTVDLYAPTTRTAAVAWVANGDADGLTAGTTHTITVTVLGTTNGASTGARVDHDAVVFLR